jgi:hypothetical protein
MLQAGSARAQQRLRRKPAVPDADARQVHALGDGHGGESLGRVTLGHHRGWGVSRIDDKKTLAALLRSTPADMHCMLIGKGSAKVAWEAIGVQYQRPDRVRDGRLRRLQTEFKTVAFKDGKKIQDFAICISNIAAMLRSLGDTVDEEKNCSQISLRCSLAICTDCVLDGNPPRSYNNDCRGGHWAPARH